MPTGQRSHRVTLIATRPQGKFAEVGVDRGRMKGNLEAILLSVTGEHGRVYGQEIVRVVGERTQGGLVLQAGSLYPSLRRLKQRGCVCIETVTSRRNHGHVTYYTITDVGREKLAEQRRLARAFIHGLQKLPRL